MLHFSDLISLMRFPLCLTVLTHKYPPKKQQQKIVSDKPAVLSSHFKIKGQPGQSIVRVHQYPLTVSEDNSVAA